MEQEVERALQLPEHFSSRDLTRLLKVTQLSQSHLTANQVTELHSITLAYSAVPRMWHIQDSEDQVLALAFRQKSSKLSRFRSKSKRNDFRVRNIWRCSFSLRSEAVQVERKDALQLQLGRAPLRTGPAPFAERHLIVKQLTPNIHNLLQHLPARRCPSPRAL